MKEFFKRYYATDDSGGGGAAVEETPEVENLEDEWENPAENLRANLAAQQNNQQQQPPYDAAAIAAEASRQTLRGLGIAPDDDEQASGQALIEQLKAEISSDLTGKIGEIFKPQLLLQVADSVCKGLGPEARERVNGRLKGTTAAQLTAILGDPESLQDLRDMAYGAHQRVTRKKVQAPGSAGAGSSQSAADQPDPHWEEWHRSVGGPVLKMDKEKSIKAFKELQQR